jgi:hypothetical protein
MNLSRLMATRMSMRDWLPQFGDDDVMPGTLPDPTFDGILPGETVSSIQNRLFEMESLWGLAQFAEEFAAFYPIVFPHDDFDGDGRENFSEWVRGTDVLNRDVLWQGFTRNLVAPGVSDVVLTFARRKDLWDWRLVVSVSDDLDTWDRMESQVEMVGAPVDNGDGFTETVTYRLHSAAALSPHKFLRVDAVPK